MSSATANLRLRLVQGGEVDPTAGLEHCPFCESGMLPIRSHDEVGPAVVCQGCGAVGPIARTDDEAVALWNARSTKGQGA